MNKKLNWSLLIIGFSGMVAQIILLRELLIVYLGNELSLGIILGNWLICEAAGAFLAGQLMKKITRKHEAFIYLQLLFSAVFPFSVISIRLFKSVLHMNPGEILGPGTVFLSSLALIILPSFIHGFLFTLSCKMKEKKDEPASSIGNVYVLETLGNITAALLLTYLLIPRFHSVDIAFITSLIISFSCLFLVFPESIANQRPALFAVRLFFFLLFLSILLLRGSETLHRFSIEKQWEGQKILSYENSVYGNIVSAQMEEQVIVYSNAHPAFISPFPDIESCEEIIHIPLLFHPDPQDAMIISGGLGGFLRELLHYPKMNIDYTELDPAIIKTAFQIDKRKRLDPLHSELNSERIHYHLVDGRLFLNETSSLYDAVFIRVSLPAELQTNRLFTKEFFLKAKSRMKKNGLLVLTLPGSLNYLTDPMKSLNGTIRSTLRSVFSSVVVIPGETNIFVSSDNALDINLSRLQNRLEERNISHQILTPFHLSLKLDPIYQEWFNSEMKKVPEKINRDLHPVSVFQSQSYLNSFFYPGRKNIFSWFKNISFVKILSLFFLPLALLPFAILPQRIYSRGVISAAVFSTGLASMFFNMAIMLLFQIFYGYIYSWISLFIAFFMAGISLGGAVSTRKITDMKNPQRAISFIQYCMLLMLLALPAAAYAFNASVLPSFAHLLFRYILLAFSLVFGFLQGYEFPLASKIYTLTRREMEKTAGFLYACDLMGGFIGGILSTIFLIPLFGLFQSCSAIFALKSAVVILLLFAQKNR
ncbi:MAG: fused MFS/spermidine synthase [Candidatus Aureabacteria bacterium]|nr:fused MFS/spermidine synthase [Candidatus Auribacterota bacterium]